MLVFAKLWTIQANKMLNVFEQEKTLLKAFGYLICTSMIVVPLFMLLNI